MRNQLFRIIRGFVIAIVIVLGFGGLFSLYTDTLSEEKQGEVLIKAIPFVAVFVSIILVFICLIVLIAIGLENKVPQRTYRPIERVIIAGILLGVAGLFQGWRLFAYEVGFLVLLASLLLFMVWSHLNPMPTRQSRQLPPLRQQAHVIGLVIGVIVGGIIAAAVISDAQPAEPYGIGQTLWNFKDDAEKAQIKEDAENDYRNSKIPLILFASLMPAVLVYLAVRELVEAQLNSRKKKRETTDKQLPASSVSG